MDALRLLTADGERLDGVHVPGDGGTGVVLAHGFTSSWRRPRNLNVLVGLQRRVGVVAFDFRGHGRSTGVCTVGDREILDVDAAVAAVRRLGYSRVVLCGWSMGGAVVLRHAALLGGVDAVASVSAPARWYYRGTSAMRRVHFVIERPVGRLAARRLLRTRISGHAWDPVPESPEEVVGKIPPTPLLLVHGDRDAFFPLEHLHALADAAGAGAEVWVERGFGHAEGAATPELVDRIARWLS
jgi:pimeloyl-ACP methyl ester carboxylesterase